MNPSRKPWMRTRNVEKDMLDDIFHPHEPICKIVPTNIHQKVDYFSVYRPLPKTCLDYSISQTDAKIDARETKIHIRQVVAEYVLNPDYKKPEVPDVKKPELPDIKKPTLPDVKEPESPDHKGPEAPDVEHPEVPKVKEPEKPDHKGPEAPDVEHPEVPNVKEPERPDHKGPEAPDVEHPEVPKVKEPKRPDHKGPKAPDVEHPEVPKVKEPERPDHKGPEAPNVTYASYASKPGTAHVEEPDVPTVEGPEAEKRFMIRSVVVPRGTGDQFPKKTKFYDGGPPQYEFLEEIFHRQQEELQKIYHVEFKKRVAKRKKTEKLHMDSEHRKVINLVGPAWYQELSPSQILTVNALKSCIVKDLAEGTVINTQENIGQLGLVLRPHHKHIEKALKNCCKCPVEFLLVLYQLMNPNRKEYSINDRLLLSAVVHLTMTDTLRELHVRIPSPPPPPVGTKKTPKKRKHVKNESPYLEPFNFKKKRPKFSGVYVDKHVQRPQCPYFSYLKEFKKMTAPGNDNKNKTSKSSTTEAEIDEELASAQAMYEALVEFRPVPKLLKPSKYSPCQNFRNSPVQTPKVPDKEEETEPPAEEGAKEEEVVPPPGIIKVPKTGEETEEGTEKETKEPKPGIIKLPKTEEETEDDKGAAGMTQGFYARMKVFVTEEEMQESLETETQEEIKVEVKEIVKEKYDEVEVKEIVKEKYDEVEVKEIIKEKYDEVEVKEIVKEEYDDDNKLSYVTDLGVKNPQEERPDHCDETSQTECYKDDKEINTIDKRDQTNQKDSCSCDEKDSEDRSKTSIVISKEQLNISSEVSQDSKKINLRRKPDKTERCKHEKDLAIYNEMYHFIRPNAPKRPCGCKENYRKSIERSLCKCKRCEQERRMKNIHFAIGGMLETENNITQVIQGVVERRPCDCLNKYDSKIETFEKERDECSKRPCGCRKLTKELIERPHCPCEKCEEDRRQKAAKLIISGTKETDDENLRIIEGTSTGKLCQCVKHYEKKIDAYEEYQKKKKAVAKLKELQEKYIIGGVVNTPDGPVYIITGLRPPIDCTCAKKAREEEAQKLMEAAMPHFPPGRNKFGIAGVKETPEGNVYILNNPIPMPDCECMELFEKFHKQHSNCLDVYEQYLAKMKDEYNEFMNEMLPPDRSRRESRASRASRVSEALEEEESLEEGDENKETVREEGEKDTGEVRQDKQTIPAPSQSSICCNCGRPYKTSCNCLNVQTVQCKKCTCDEESAEVECINCMCGGTFGGTGVTPSSDISPRILIFPKFLTDRKWQMKTLKTALRSMAEDEYPLAKLPESYKLPQFKLWMQMRCKQFWTKEDGYRYICHSKDMWRHTRSCKKWPITFPKLAISKSEARLLDWSKAPTCRKLVNDVLDKFYRQLKQNIIHFGREYYPTTFCSEFPFKTWRDCYFAYTPSKEEEVQARQVWQQYDFKNYADMNRFCS